MTRPSTRHADRTAVPLDASEDADRPTTPRVVAVAFWTAVVLPVVHVPLLTLGPPTGDRAVVVVLVALNVLALAVGHPYGRDDPVAE